LWDLAIFSLHYVQRVCPERTFCSFGAIVFLLRRGEERLNYCKLLRHAIHTTLWCHITSKSARDIPQLDASLPEGEPKELPGFKIGSRLGQGRFGTVYIAISDNNNDPPSAIKVLAKEGLTRVEDVRYLNRMISVMRHLSREPHCHPNLVRMYETYHSPTHIIIRMEFAGQENLFQRLRAREKRSEAEQRPLSLQRVLDMVQQLVGVLAHMHTTARCCHRDIKPENVITREDDDGITVKLTDFDLTVIISPSTTCRSACGTLPFTAPEVLLDAVYDGCCADVWSLGVVLMEIFCGLNVVEGVIGQAASPQEMATRIRAYFQAPDAAQKLMERACRQELRVSLRGLKPIVSGMLESDVYQRLEADELLSVINQQFLASAS
jgi:serine/threonine protein kinase